MSSVQLYHLLTVMIWIAEQSLSYRVNNEIEQLKGNLANEDGAIIGKGGNLDGAVPALNRKHHGFIDVKHALACGSAGRTNTSSL